MTDLDFSDAGFTLAVSWQMLFLIGLVALFIALAKMTAKTHGLKVPQLHERPIFNLALCAGAMLAAVLAVIALYEFAAILLITDYLEEDTDRHTALRNVGLFLAAVFSAPFLVWRTVIASKQAHTAEQGLYTDRIAKAVEQIGADKVVKRQRKDESGNLTYERDEQGNRIFSKPVMIEETVRNLEVRIGGLLSLERIARDSLIDHVAVMEIICAYIRQNSASNSQFSTLAPGSVDRMADLVDKLMDPPLDLGIALTILARRTKQQIAVERAAGFRIDLTAARLAHFRLRLKNFENAILNDVVFDGADLSDSEFKEAEIFNASFQNTDLTNVDMSEAQLYDCTFAYPVCDRTNLTRTAFLQLNLTGNINLKNAITDCAGFFDCPVGKRFSYSDPYIELAAKQLNSTFGTLQEDMLANDTLPKHWISPPDTFDQFFELWRAWQDATSFDSENPEGSA